MIYYITFLKNIKCFFPFFVNKHKYKDLFNKNLNSACKIFHFKVIYIYGNKKTGPKRDYHLRKD